MEILSTTIDYKGNPIKIEDGKVFVLQFGTTINNHSMHHSWTELPEKHFKKEFKQFLIDNKLI